MVSTAAKVLRTAPSVQTMFNGDHGQALPETRNRKGRNEQILNPMLPYTPYAPAPNLVQKACRYLKGAL